MCGRVAPVGLGCCRCSVAKKFSKRCVRHNGIGVSRSECIVLRERPQCGVSLCAPCGLWLILRKNLRDLLNCIPITVRGWNPQKLLNLSEVTDRLHFPPIKAQNESVLNRDDLEQPVVC